MRKTRWIGVGQLSDETGLAVRTLQYVVQREPEVLVTRNGKRGIEFEQPTCAVNLRKREAEQAAEKSKPANMEEAERRLAIAQAEMAELKLGEMRKELMTVADYDRAVGGTLARVDARLKSLPQRIAATSWPVDYADRVTAAQGLVEEVRGELRSREEAA